MIRQRADQLVYSLLCILKSGIHELVYSLNLYFKVLVSSVHSVRTASARTDDIIDICSTFMAS